MSQEHLVLIGAKLLSREIKCSPADAAFLAFTGTIEERMKRTIRFVERGEEIDVEEVEKWIETVPISKLKLKRFLVALYSFIQVDGVNTDEYLVTGIDKSLLYCINTRTKTDIGIFVRQMVKKVRVDNVSSLVLIDQIKDRGPNPDLIVLKPGVVFYPQSGKVGYVQQPEKKKLPVIRKYQKEEISIVISEEKVKIENDISVTRKDLRKMIDKDSFIDKYMQQIQKSVNYKQEIFERKLNDVKRTITTTQEKFDQMKKSGFNSTFKDAFPYHEDNITFSFVLQGLIDDCKAYLAKINQKTIRENLIEALDDPEHGMASVIGREEVLDKICCQIYAFSKNFKNFSSSFNNMLILGPAGCGKTKLAGVISFVFSKSGMLMTNKFKVVTKMELVGQYIGSTAPRTRAALSDMIEGILMVDEAYQLGTKLSFDAECLAEIVNFLDKYIGLGIVILCGYKKQMLELMNENEGLTRRFPFVYEFKPYNMRQLCDILCNCIEEREIRVSEQDSNKIFSILCVLNKQIPGLFKNQAGEMINLATFFVNTINSAIKLSWDKKKDREELIQIVMTNYLEKKGHFIVFE